MGNDRAWMGLGLLVGLALAPRSADARVYPIPILADTEDDLRLLIEDGVLDPDDFETLLEMLSNPVDLNRANKNQVYDLPGVSLKLAGAIVDDRRANGPFASQADLARVPGVTDEIVAQARLFAYAEPRPDKPRLEDLRTNLKMRGSYFIQDRSTFSASQTSSNSTEELGYGKLPQSYVATRVEHPWGFEAGFVGLQREAVVRAAYSPADQAIYADWGYPALQLGRLWGSVERGRYSAIAGHYTAGFGLGITFDSTNRTRPQGWYPDMAVNTDIEDGDFRLRQALVGVSGRVEDVPLGSLLLESTVFVSSRTPDVYQYHMAVTGDEAFDPDSPDLSSPRVFIDGYKAAYITVPNAYRENLVGLNTELNARGRTRFGLTGWMGFYDKTALDGTPDNEEWYVRQRVADDNQFGAFGAYAGHSVGGLDFTGEYARSLSGGNAIQLMALYDDGPAEIELSARHFDTTYDNPHARGIAAADVYRGFRDRDEQGLRLRTEIKPVKVFKTRWMVDAWKNLSTDRANLEVFGRVQLDPQKWLMLAAMADHRNRDLANNGRTRIYGGDYADQFADAGDFDEDVTVITDDTNIVDGAGSRNYWALQTRFSLIPATQLELFYRRVYEDAGLVYPQGGEICEPGFQIGTASWAKVRVKPTDSTTLTARWRYWDDDVHGSKGDRFTDGYLQAQQKINKTWSATLRGGLRFDLVDLPAEWADACKLVGRPDLEAACGVTVDTDTALSAAKKKPEALILATVEARFR